MISNNNTSKDVTVIGLGMMGAALARLLLDNQYNVTVWNRTRVKAEPLIEKGAILAPSLAAAIRASVVVVICVYDYEVANSILRTDEVASDLAGRVLVQLTTGSPEDARESEAWALERGAGYIDGAIQAAPGQMGRADTPILVSGAESSFRTSKHVLDTFGGGVKYLGEKVSAAATVDLATLSYIYGATLGFFHGARIIESAGLSVASYGSLVAGISPTFGEFLRHEGEVIQSEDYTVSESPLRISAEATSRLVQTARKAGINPEFPVFASGLFTRALQAGYGDQEAAALIKILRQRG